jgi:hypothetical protein
MGNKYVKQYVLEEMQDPGSCTSCTILRPMEKGIVGQFFVFRVDAFDCIDKLHQSNDHTINKRTLGDLKGKFRLTNELITQYCQTFPVCIKNKLVTQPAKDSRKPIRSRQFQDRLQIYLIDFHKLRKRDPFGVLMHWVLVIKDHATGLIYLCALPWKCPNLVAYKLQEIFGIFGFPKIFHTDNVKEFTAKVVLMFLCQMNPNITSVTG